ncbi:type IV pilus assembly protein PilZ [Leptospira broomii serovar Hurstbridge str. 5399]|uniref:Type IV pilus assembly protein PilZ n=1 Tax=Leptospira broomii serovar Hurstbridge str. 5399 TaxID=1049789 RepID=T0FG62_9LEPT|nr:PilZ domain-containing protein [Leptospira broomii]EQA46572.1 type IV pilus assembly protein PilZ [Leptospira broomii serovar Hurstbridge str. 5399]
MKYKRERERLISKELSELSTTLICDDLSISGLVANISEIGMGILVQDNSKEPPPVGSSVSGKITGEVFGELDFEGVIVRNERSNDSDSINYIIGIKFTSEISLPDRVIALSLTIDE